MENVKGRIICIGAVSCFAALLKKAVFFLTDDYHLEYGFMIGWICAWLYFYLKDEVFDSI